MYTHPSFRLRRVATLLAVTLSFPLVFAQQTAAPASPAPAASGREDSVIVLSPFEIAGEDYTGYQANTTLAGSRLNSKVSDLAASITIMTPEFFQDIGATSLQDALVFAPNTEFQEFRDANPDNQAQFNGAQYRVRGFEGGAGGLSRGFFRTGVAADVYNIERLTFNRGPNSILFGSGAVYGIIDNAPKQARYKSSAQLQFKTDTDGSLRGTLDVNRTLLDRKLALRVALLSEDRRTWKEPAFNRNHRAYLAARLDPTPRTTVHANFEYVESEATIVTGYSALESYRRWRDSGSPAYNPAVGGPFPAGTQAAGANRLVIDNGFTDPAGFRIYNRNGTAISRGHTVDGFELYPASQGDLFPDSIVPFGPNQTRAQQAGIVSASVEQRVTESLFLQLAYNREDVKFNTRLGSITPQVSIDPNARFRDGTPNPNFGRPYFELADQRWNFLPGVTDTWRLTAAYELDLTDKSRWLGRHRVAALGERERSERFHDKFSLRNFTPAEFNAIHRTNFNTNLTNAQNQIELRQFFTPGDTSSMTVSPYGLDYFSTPRNLAPGVNAGWARVLAPNRDKTEFDTWGVSGQSHWLNDRLVTTAGVRHDQISQFSIANSRLPDGQFQDPRLERYDPASTQNVDSVTRSLGGVFKVTNWFSLTYNQSDNLNRPSSRTDYYGRTMPSPAGEGRDYGFRVDLLEGRLVGSVTWFETNIVDDEMLALNNPAGGARRNVALNIASIQETLNPAVYDATLTDTSNVSGLRDFEAKGTELSLLYNPVRAWRMALNVGRKENVQASSNKEYFAYLAEYRAQFEANAARPLATPATSVGIATVGDALRDADQTIAFRQLNNGRKSAAEREWTVNFVTSYDLPPLGRVRGLRIGGTAQWGSAATVGYFKDAAGNFDVNRPIDAGERLDVGTFVRYSRKIRRDRSTLSVQLNIRNLLDDRLTPVERVEDRFGEVGPAGGIVTTRYLVRPPRSAELTCALDF